LLEAEGLEDDPSPQPASIVRSAPSPTKELRYFLNPNMFNPISA